MVYIALVSLKRSRIKLKKYNRTIIPKRLMIINCLKEIKTMTCNYNNSYVINDLCSELYALYIYRTSCYLSIQYY